MSATFTLTQEELNMLKQVRKDFAKRIKGMNKKTLLIKIDATGSYAISILDSNNRQTGRCVLTTENMDMLASYYRKYMDIYNVKKCDTRVSKAELGFVKEYRYKKIFEEMSSEKLPIIFRFTTSGLYLEIRNKAKTNIHSIELNIDNSIQFREFLFEN